MKQILTTILFILIGQAAIAQQFKWVKTIGSMHGGALSLTLNEGEHTKFLCTDPQKNLYAANLVGDSTLKADTFYQARGPNNPFNASLLLTSYRCDGTMRWARLLNGTGDVLCFGMQYNAGSIYVAGRFGDTGANRNRAIAGIPLNGHDSQHYFLARFDTLGTLNWIRFVGANDKSSEIVLDGQVYGTDDHSLAIDGQGNIHHYAYLNTGVKITPLIIAQKGTYDLKYNPAGTLIGVVRLGVDSNYFLYDHAGNAQHKMFNRNSLSISKKSGKVYTVMSKVAFNTLHQPVYSQYRLCAFSPSGMLIWEDSLSGISSSHQVERIRDACYDGENAIYISGEGRFGMFQFQGVSPTYPGKAGAGLTTIIKVDTNGKPVWIYSSEHKGNARQLGSTTILPNGNILAAGDADGTVSHGKDSLVYPFNNRAFPFYTIVTPTGSLVRMDKAEFYRRSSSFIDQFSSIAVDLSGNIYFGGMQGGDTLNFPDGISNSKYKFFFNSQDGFIAKLGLDCRCTAPAKAGYKDSIVMERTVYFSYTGTTEAVDSIVWTYGGGQKKKVTTGFGQSFFHTYSSGGAYLRDTVCVTVYSACGVDKYCTYPPPLSVSPTAGLAGLRIYPNPVQAGRFTVAFEAGKAIGQAGITITDISGRQVFSRAYSVAGSSFNEQIDIKGVAPGMYFIHIGTMEGRVTRSVMVE